VERLGSDLHSVLIGPICILAASEHRASPLLAYDGLADAWTGPLALAVARSTRTAVTLGRQA